MPFDSPPNIPRQEVFNEYDRVLQKFHNMKNVAARSGFFMESKLMMLKLRKARLGAQLAYSRHQSLITELELQLAEADLKCELIRRRQFVTRSRAIRQIMKLPSHGTDRKTAITETEKTTVDKSTQVEKGIDEKKKRNPEKKNRREERRSNYSSEKKRVDRIDKDRRKASRVGTDETPRDTARAATSSKGTDNCNQSKEKKTDKDGHSSDKREKPRSREKRRDKREGETKSDKDRSQKTEKVKKIDIRERSDKQKEKHARKGREVKSAKIKKRSDSDEPTAKENINDTDRTRVRNIKPSGKCNGEKIMTTEGVNDICDPTEDNDENIDILVNAAQPSKKCDASSSCDLDVDKTDIGPVLTVVLETLDSNLVQRIQKMCATPTKEILEGFENFENVKRERSHSISSVETLLLQEDSD